MKRYLLAILLVLLFASSGYAAQGWSGLGDASLGPGTLYYDGSGGFSTTYDPTPDTDQTYTCVVCNAGQTAGENLSYGNPVYKAADGKWYKTDSDAEATCSQLDIQVVVTAAGIAADATGTLMSDGWIRDDSFGLSTVGAPLYFQGDTVGDPGWFTETPPSGSGYVVRKMGSTSSTVAVGGMDVIRFKPESSYVVVP